MTTALHKTSVPLWKKSTIMQSGITPIRQGEKEMNLCSFSFSRRINDGVRPRRSDCKDQQASRRVFIEAREEREEGILYKRLSDIDKAEHPILFTIDKQ